MSEDDLSPEIDWNELRLAATNIAEILYTYHQSLIATGFDAGQSLTLTVAYQQILWGRMS